MKSTLKYDKVILIKELNDKFRKVGEEFEIASVSEDSFLLRDAKSKVAIGVISFQDFEKCFVHEENFKGWTDWQQFNGLEGQTDCFYRTNRRDVEVKFVTDKVRTKSYLHKDDEFNLSFGLNLAYLRAFSKVLEKKKDKVKEKLCKVEEEHKEINDEIANVERHIQKLINSVR